MARHGITHEEYLASIGLGLDQLFQRRSNGRRWVDSTPANVLVGPKLALLFPNAQFLHIVRDGRWVVLFVALSRWNATVFDRNIPPTDFLG